MNEYIFLFHEAGHMLRRVC